MKQIILMTRKEMQTVKIAVLSVLPFYTDCQCNVPIHWWAVKCFVTLMLSGDSPHFTGGQ